MTNDAFLWYNVGDWGRFGLAVPNFSNDTRSQNGTIRYLTDVVGRNLQAIMWHPDARLRTPPSINTLTRIHKLCTRARSILASRAVPANVLNMETAHALPAPEEFLVYPAPYFKVRNQWMKQYSGLILLALTEAMQHQENARPLEISENFAGLFGQYVQRVYRLMATELFRIPLADAAKPDFTITDEQLRTYDPSAWFTSTEMIDTVAPLEDWPTEDDLEVLTDGIPISHLPVLGRWPAGPVSSGTANGQPATSASEAFAPAPTV